MRFILLDRIVELDIGERIIATKTFCPQEEFFLDHFPGFPVVPGTLLTEVMAQAGGWLVATTENFRFWPFLSMIDKVKFRQFVRPGEALQIEASIRSSEERQYWVSAKISRSDQWVARARLFYHLMDQPEVVFDNTTLGYPFNRTGCRLRRWITLVLARTIRGPWASSRPGSAPMRTVLDYLEWL